MKKLPPKIALPIALLAGSAFGAVIENDSLKVEFRKADAAFDVTDKSSGRVWRMMEGEGTSLEVSDVKASGREISFAARSRAPALDMRMRLALEGRELSVSISAPADAKIAETRLDWPYPFAGERGDRVLLTQGNGFAFPVEMTDLGTDKIDLSNYPGRDMEMGCWGQYAETLAPDGEILPAAGCLAIIETPENSGIRYTVRRNGFRQANVSWQHDRLAFGHDRRVRFVFGKKFGPMEMALRYREEMKRKGYWVSFAEKRRRYPHLAEKIDLLIGAPNVWYWAEGGDKAGVARRLKELGFENILMQFATRHDLGTWVTPEEIRAVAAVPGVIAGEYDIYKDFMDPANIPLIDCTRPHWPTNVWENGDYVTDSGGAVVRGWGVDRRDGKGRIGCAALCESRAWPYALDRIGRAVSEAPHSSRLIDVVGGCLGECWNPAHPLNRRQSRDARSALFDNIQRRLGLLVGTEDGGEWCVPTCCYFEGTMSAPDHYRVDGGRYMWKVYDEVPDVVLRGLDETTRVPFFEMVFHGCVVTYWYWCDYNNKFPSLWRKHDLFNALYGTPPMYLFTPDTFAGIQSRLAESRVVATSTAKLAGTSPMCGFRWLTPDRSVQQSRFENGVVCTVNFGDGPYKMSDGRILPPEGFCVESADQKAAVRTLTLHPVGDPGCDRRAEVMRLVAASSPGDELHFARGEYFFSGPLALKGCTNLVMRADRGSVFRFPFRADGLATGAVVGFQLDGCSDVRIEGITYTTDRPVSVSGRVEAVYPDANEYDVRLSGDSFLAGTEPLCAVDTCDAHGSPDRVMSRFHLNTVDADDGRGGKAKRSRGIPYKVVAPGLIRVEALDPRELGNLKEGHRVVYRLALWGGVCNVRDSRRITFRDCTVWRSPGISFVVAPLSEDITFEGLRISPEPGSGALYSSNADGIHVAGMSGTLTLRDCVFEGLGDDPLNVHGKVAELACYDQDAGVATCGWRLSHGELRPMGDKWAVAGDVLAVYPRETFVEKGRVEVMESRGGGEYVFAAPTGAAPRVGDVLVNTRDRPKVRISGCAVRNVRSRGFLLQSQDVSVSNCTFAGIGGSGIMAAPDINNWYESGPVAGLSVRNCSFERCGVRPGDFGAVTVKVNHQGAVDAFPAGVHRGIEVSGCMFRDSGCGATNICIASAAGVRVSACRFESLRAEGEPVVFVNCEDVEYDGSKGEPAP